MFNNQEKNPSFQTPVIFQQPIYSSGYSPYNSLKGLTEERERPETPQWQRYCIGITAVIVGVALILGGIGIALAMRNSSQAEDTATTTTSTTQQSITTTTTVPSPATFNYIVSGKVTIDDDVTWPYVSGLSVVQSTNYQMYEQQFCEEIGSSAYLASLYAIDCNIGQFREGSLVIDFVIEFTEETPNGVAGEELTAYIDQQVFLASNAVIDVFTDDQGTIRNVSPFNIELSGISLTPLTGVTTIEDVEYTPELSDTSSSEFNNLANQFCAVIEAGLTQNSMEDNICSVQAMSPGSVNVLYTVTKINSNTQSVDMSQFENGVMMALESTNQFTATHIVLSDALDNLCDNLACGQRCENVMGVPSCLCNPGYVLDPSEQCRDINECNENNGGCSHTCTNVDGSFSCSCPEGYHLDEASLNCLETNECSSNNGGCSHTCTNSAGSFSCSCPDGFQLNGDNLACSDINECENDNGGCSHTCDNIDGTFFCSCPPGYELDNSGFTCTDINECMQETRFCEGTCSNTDGSYVCGCHDGMRLDDNGATCSDINECMVDNGGCEQICVNGDANYHCACTEGELQPDGHSCDTLIAPTSTTTIVPSSTTTTSSSTASTTTPSTTTTSTTTASTTTTSTTRTSTTTTSTTTASTTESTASSSTTTSTTRPSTTTSTTTTDQPSTTRRFPRTTSSLPGYCNIAEEFVCGNGQSIPCSRHCDNRLDCEDASDEMNCACPSDGYVPCDLGRCIPDIKWCDNKVDCLDASDEVRGCPSGCPESTFQCDYEFERFRCAPQSIVCDGVPDCLGAADELNCVCNATQTQCHWGMCMPQSNICDGKNDCLDWSDELNCFDQQGMECPQEHVKCDGEEVLGNQGDYFCLPNLYLCDRLNDCPLGEDETEENCRLKEETIESCVGVINVTAPGNLSSPFYPGYPHGVLCNWTLVAEEGYRVALNFADISLQACPFCNCDFLQVHDALGYQWSVCSMEAMPVAFISFGNVLNVIFKSDRSVSDPGFFAAYSQTMNDPLVPEEGRYSFLDRVGPTPTPMSCVHDMDATMPGNITSPGFPSNYPNNIYCTYTLTADEGYSVALHFLEFYLEEDIGCDFDSVQVFDGDEIKPSAIIWEGCGVFSNFTTVTRTNVMTVVFKTDNSITRQGFFAYYYQTITGGSTYPGQVTPGPTISPTFIVETTSPGQMTSGSSTTPTSTGGGQLSCNVDIDASTPANFSSPGYPFGYPNLLTCSWTLIADEGYRVAVNFIKFNLEYASNCQYDRVDIYNGDVRENSQLLWYGCGLLANNFTAVSSGNALTIVLMTDASQAEPGFFVSYYQTTTGVSSFPEPGAHAMTSTPTTVSNTTATPGPGCGGYIDVMANGPGHITSPGYPENYGDDLHCIWELYTNGQYIISLFLDDFRLEDASPFLGCLDYFAVRDASTEREYWRGCGDQSGGVIPVTSERIIIEFISDSSIANSGFNVSYSIVAKDTMFPGATGLIISQESNVYGNDVILRSNVIATGGRKTWLMHEISLEEGVLENFYLYTHSISEGGDANVTLKLQIWREQGVDRIYRLVYEKSVTVDHSNAEGVFHVFDVADDEFTVQQNDYVGWTIDREQGVISLTFAETQSVRFRNLEPPPSIDQDYEFGAITLPAIFSVAVKIRPDTSNPFQCGGNIDLGAGGGSISSPDHPMDYPPNLECHWVFTAEQGKQVALEFSAFNLEDCDKGCECDRIEIWDGAAPSDVIWIGCGELAATFTAVSTLNVLTLVFVTDQNIEEDGYMLNYFQTENGQSSLPETIAPICGSREPIEVTSTRNAIFSPGYPGNYPDNALCKWHLMAPVGYQVSLEFLYFSIEYGSACQFDGLSIFEDSNDEPIWTGCGIALDSFTIVSSGRNLSLAFYSDQINLETYPGFILFYQQTTSGQSSFPELFRQTTTSSSPQTTTSSSFPRRTTPSPLPYTSSTGAPSINISSEEKECARDEGFLCNTGECIEYPMYCDGKQDCADSSDEAYCKCQSFEFACADDRFKCISKVRRCDGVADCVDHSDEWYCECPIEKFECKSEKRCLPKNWLCNGVVECEGGQDEMECGDCLENEFQCSSTECVATELLCDGERQCADGSDEKGCIQLSSSETDQNAGILTMVRRSSGDRFAVCSTNWNSILAHVACKQMGLLGPAVYSTITVDSLTSDMQEFVGIMTVPGSTDVSSIIQGATFGEISSCNSVVQLSCQQAMCGTPSKEPLPVNAAIINSDLADIEAFPWQVSLDLPVVGGHGCGGSLLNDQWVVTAAHCVERPDGLRIRIGSDDISSSSGLYDVEEIFEHPNYGFTTRQAAVDAGTIYNDIALIKLAEPVVLDGRRKMPICLPPPWYTRSHYTRCFATGWGATSAGVVISYPQRLRQGRMDPLDISECQAIYTNQWSKFPFKVWYNTLVSEENHVCAGLQNQYTQFCFGDSGGPLSCEDGYGNWFLVGIVSFTATHDCLAMSVFENPVHHLSWINDVIQENP